MCVVLLHSNALLIYMRALMLVGLKSRRSKLEINLDVLDAIKNGTEKPTRIMYESNLSWKILNNTLSNLISQNLIEKFDMSDSRDKRTNKVYKITQKGDALTRYFRHAEQLLKLDEPVTHTMKVNHDEILHFGS